MRIFRLGVLASVLFIVGYCAGVANAQTPTPTTGDAEYITKCWGRNLYTEDLVVCSFFDLHPDLTYGWRVQTLNESGGVIDTLYSTSSIADGVRVSASIQFGGSFGQNGNFPTNYAGPFRIIDNFDVVKLAGHMMPDPHTSWATDTPNTLEIEKQALGTNDRFGGPYIQFQFAGWHNNKSPVGYVVPFGSYSIMHYRIDLPSVPTTDELFLYDVATGTQIGRFSLQQIIDYNHDPTFIALYTERESERYMVFNTDGLPLEFIDEGYADLEFLGSTFEKPHEFNSGLGVFHLQRRTAAGAAYISDAEGLYIVSSGSQNGEEWRVTATNETLGVGQLQTVDFFWLDEAVHQAFTGTWSLVDTVSGTIDSNTYSYLLNRRSDPYVVSGTAVQACVIQTYEPFVISTAVEFDVIDAQEIFFDCYNVIEGLATGDRIRAFLEVWGLDTDLGQTIALVLALLGGMALIRPLGGGLALQSIVYMAVGAAFVLSGTATLLISFIWGVSVLYLLFYLATNMRSGSVSSERLS